MCKKPNGKSQLKAAGLIFLFLCHLCASPIIQGAPVKVILDTDMLTDPEDANALCLLNTLADRSEAEILACVVNGHDTNRCSGAAVDVINTWYGRTNIPIGSYKGAYPVGDSPFTRALRDQYPHTAPDDDALPSAVDVYREVLAKQPDQSVVIISIGFLMNLWDLEASAADQYSKWPGSELIKRKVKKLVVMGGCYPSGKEYNFSKENAGKCTAETIERWPDQIPIVFNGHEIGGRVISGRSYKEKLKDGPLRTALEHNSYKALLGRESWDELTVLCGVRGLFFQNVEYWKLHSRGSIFVNPSDGSDEWRESPQKNQSYLVEALPPAEMGKVLEDLILSGPKAKVH